jgi:hypothetical protein
MSTTHSERPVLSSAGRPVLLTETYHATNFHSPICANLLAMFQ